MQRENRSTNVICPSLLTSSEIDWLLGNKQVSPSYERKMRCVINKKLETLTKFEIPLLLDNGFYVTIDSSGVTTGSNTTNDLVAQPGRALAWEGGKKHQLPSHERENGASGGITGDFRRFRTRDLYLTKYSNFVEALGSESRPESFAPVFTNSSAFSIDWNTFQKYLESSNNGTTVKIRMLYAKRYYHILQDGNAQELLTLSDDVRMGAMKSLTALSKFLGCYDLWKAIWERYQLKWTAGADSLDIFNQLYAGGDNYTQMLSSWLRDMVSELPKNCGNILIFDVLTGLRPNEALNSLSKIHRPGTDLKTGEPIKYVNIDRMTLEHFRYPDVFIRRTKKAYISIINQDIIELAKSSKNCGYNALRLYITKRGKGMKMKYCRKIFGTYLRTNGVEQEVIDLLQGRVPKSVFARHYFRPDFSKTCKRVRQLIPKLYAEIEQLS